MQRFPLSAVVLPAVALAPLNVAGTAIALPTIATELSFSTTALQWTVNSFNLAFAGAMIAAGFLADGFGPRRTFAVGLLLMTISSAASALSPSLLVLDTCRALAGISCAAITAGGLASFSRTHPAGPSRSRLLALFGVTAGVGLSFGPTITGIATELIGWRGLYAIFGVIACVPLALSSRLPGGRGPIADGQRLVDLRIFRIPRFVAFALAPLVPAVGFVPIYTYLPVALSAVFDLTATQSGLFMVPTALPVLLGPVLALRLVRSVLWIRSETVVLTSCAALLLGDLGMLVLSPDRPIASILVPLMLVSLGYGLQMGMVDAEAMASVPRHGSGAAAGLVNFSRSGSTAITVTVFGMYLASLIRHWLPGVTAHRVAAGEAGHGGTFASAFHAVSLGAAVAVAAFSIMIAWLLRRADHTPRQEGVT